jgi:hypothetical protein
MLYEEQVRSQWDRELLLLWEARSRSRGEFGNPEEGECPPLEAAIKQRLLKALTDWEDLVCSIVICEVCRTVQSSFVVASCKSSINPITNPKPVYTHTITWQYIYIYRERDKFVVKNKTLWQVHLHILLHEVNNVLDRFLRTISQWTVVNDELEH